MPNISAPLRETQKAIAYLLVKIDPSVKHYSEEIKILLISSFTAIVKMCYKPGSVNFIVHEKIVL